MTRGPYRGPVKFVRGERFLNTLESCGRKLRGPEYSVDMSGMMAWWLLAAMAKGAVRFLPEMRPSSSRVSRAQQKQYDGLSLFLEGVNEDPSYYDS